MKNTSGIFPAGNRVVVLPDDIEKKTEGGIVIPETVTEQHAYAQSIGTLVAVGPDAWLQWTTTKYRYMDGGWKPMEREVTGYSKPFAKPGDRIAYAKYNGLAVIGSDGKTYRIMNDEDITAHVDEAVDFTEIHSRKALGVG